VGHHAAGLTGVAGLPPRVARLGDGRIAFLLSPQERVILGGYLAGLTDRLAAPAGELDGEPDEDLGEDLVEDPGEEDPTPGRDPVIARLYPDAIPSDPAASAAFRDLVMRDLVDDRLARLATVMETIDATSLDDAQAGAWLGALNDLRLVLGTELDVTEDDLDVIDEHDPDMERKLVYGYSAWLQGQLVDVLADALPDVEDGDDTAPRR
jgi:Domain of unknown function (DUF2017)